MSKQISIELVTVGDVSHLAFSQGTTTYRYPLGAIGYKRDGDRFWFYELGRDAQPIVIKGDYTEKEVIAPAHTDADDLDDQLQAFLFTASGGGTVSAWGDIGGTLSDQTDLQSALDAKQATSGKDASNGYAGLTLLKINFKNVANTFTSFFTNANTAARTYTFQDRNGTIADLADLAIVTETADASTALSAGTLTIGNTTQEFNLTSASATETITALSSSQTKSIKIFPESGLILTFTSGSSLKCEDGIDVVVNGTNGDWVEFTKRSSVWYQTNGANY